MSDERVTGGGVTVVVPHYGDPAPTLRLIEELRGQATSRPIEVVVVDDASPEPFPEAAADGGPVPVSVVRREQNGGFGSAVNTGVARAAHPLLLVLNSDTTVDPDFVEAFVTQAQPWLPAVVGPLVRTPAGKAARTARHYPTAMQQTVEWLTPLARFRHHRLLHEAVGHDTRAVPGAVLPVDWVVGAALLVPTEVFRTVGGFDEGFHMNSEEVDLQMRLRARGVPSVFLGTVELTHVGHGSSDPERRRGWLVDSRLRYARLHGGHRRLRAALTAATAVNAVVNTGRRLAGRPVHPVATAREELRLIHGGRR